MAVKAFNPLGRPQAYAATLTIALTLLAAPVFAWDVTTTPDLCILSHDTDGASVQLTFRPSAPEYTITITSPSPWPEADQFAMQFDGAQPNVISTDQQVLTPDALALSVSDRGFGNVLDGLQYNDTATAMSGGVTVTIPLDGAAPAVAAFRACGQTPSA